jgi:hypothetical protein
MSKGKYMSQINSLSTSDLAQFTGTEKLYRITRRHVLTDGTKYLAEEGKCFWLSGFSAFF